MQLSERTENHMTEWIITCNTKAYNVIGAFNKMDTIDWKQSTNVEIGDIIYIYVGEPIHAIRYKCESTIVEQSENLIADSEFVLDDSNYGNYGRYMRLHLLKEYNTKKLGYDFLKSNGLKTVQGPSKVTPELSAYLCSVTEQQDYPEETALISGNPDFAIEKLITQFIKKLPSILPEEKELEKIRTQFVNDFNMNKLMNMTKEEYVIGLGKKDTFCYRIENELQSLGNIHGSTSAKFGLYYGKKGNDTEEKYRCTKKFGDNPDDVLEEIKKQIIYLRIDGEKKDLEAIRKCELPPLFRGKILAVYFPEDYLCILADEHLDFFMKKLGIPVSASDDILDKQNKLVEWKNSRPEMKTWSNHLFSNFLYISFGRPLENLKSYKEIQDEKDKSYPRDYVTNLGITIEIWKELLGKSEVFKPADIALLKRFYLSENHAATCYDLSIQDGVSPTSYISPIVALAKRISDALNLPPVLGDDGSQVWWRIPFWGRYRQDNRFEWKLRPKLAKAMADVFPELDSNSNFESEEKKDNELVEALKQANVTNIDNFEYVGKPKEKEAPIYTNGYKIYPRNKQIAINALAHAQYECEIDKNHPTFIRKASNKKYTEPHHLVPMAFSDEYDVSLDVEENIVSLCSNCHNQIHYGKEADMLLRKLYQERKDVLENVGIVITLEQLLSMYGY